MVKIETTHKLLDDEISTLRQLIGKKINAIYCSGASLWSHSNFYEFNDTINLRIDKKEGFIAISAIFDETKFGDNFIKININQVKDPIGIKKNEEGNLLLPLIDLHIYPEFIISKIEVYGESYSEKSENNKPNPYWKIEKDNPGQPIIERVETENILLFYSGVNRRFIINPCGVVPWLNVTFDNEMIDGRLKEKDRKLKYKIK